MPETITRGTPDSKRSSGWGQTMLGLGSQVASAATATFQAAREFHERGPLGAILSPIPGAEPVVNVFERILNHPLVQPFKQIPGVREVSRVADLVIGGKKPGAAKPKYKLSMAEIEAGERLAGQRPVKKVFIPNFGSGPEAQERGGTWIETNIPREKGLRERVGDVVTKAGVEAFVKAAELAAGAMAGAWIGARSDLENGIADQRLIDFANSPGQQGMLKALTNLVGEGARSVLPHLYPQELRDQKAAAQDEQWHGQVVDRFTAQNQAEIDTNKGIWGEAYRKESEALSTLFLQQQAEKYPLTFGDKEGFTVPQLVEPGMRLTPDGRVVQDLTGIGAQDEGQPAVSFSDGTNLSGADFDPASTSGEGSFSQALGDQTLSTQEMQAHEAKRAAVTRDIMADAQAAGAGPTPTPTTTGTTTPTTTGTTAQQPTTGDPTTDAQIAGEPAPTAPAEYTAPEDIDSTPFVTREPAMAQEEALFEEPTPDPVAQPGDPDFIGPPAPEFGSEEGEDVYEPGKCEYVDGRIITYQTACPRSKSALDANILLNERDALAIETNPQWFTDSLGESLTDPSDPQPSLIPQPGDPDFIGPVVDEQTQTELDQAAADAARTKLAKARADAAAESGIGRYDVGGLTDPSAPA